mmetsp:Transcript_30248/g.59236  ORF Transcript_30248/g.59236 Transcript_30248/m.59236 type:complete len:114 (+) Transcript_30248:369-710(+)
MCVGGSLAAIQALTMPVYAMDRASAEQARIARRAKMKEKYGSGELTKEETRLLKEVEQEESKKAVQKAAAEAGTELGINKDVASLQTNKAKQRASIRERLIAQGGGQATGDGE